MTPGVIGVKLQAMPRALAEINLQSVVIRVSLGHGVTFGSAEALRIRIRLEVVDGVARARSIEGTCRNIGRAGAKSGAHQIAKVRHGALDSRQSDSHGSGLAGLQLVNKLGITT